MSARVYISDLDGTLLQPDARLSEHARKRLDQFHARGIRFTVCTARSLVSVQNIMAGVDLHLPVMCENGGHIAWMNTGETVHLETLDSPTAISAYEIGQRLAVSPMVAHARGGEFSLSCPEPSNEGQRWFAGQRIAFQDPRYRIVTSLRPAFEEEVMCMTFIDRLEVLADLETTLRGALRDKVMIDLFENGYSPGWWWLTVQSPAVSKGNGLTHLAERDGFGLAETVVFGDALNDIPLFKAGGHAIAVGNAMPEVKEFANEIIDLHTADAVVEWIAAREGIA